MAHLEQASEDQQDGSFVIIDKMRGFSPFGDLWEDKELDSSIERIGSSLAKL